MRRVSAKINPASNLPSHAAAGEETLTFTPDARKNAEAVLGQHSLGQLSLDRIGNTPLLRLERLTCDLPGIEILGKAEWVNPGGSVKDRAAANIIAEARRAGKFGPGKTLLDSTSGNTGIAYAMIGTARRLKELNAQIRCISLQPDSPFHGIEGAKHMASAIVPKIYDPSLADVDLGIATEDAYVMAKRLAREEGLLVGISAAAAIVGCLQVAQKLKKDEPAIFVTILCDSGDKYVRERFR